MYSYLFFLLQRSDSRVQDCSRRAGRAQNLQGLQGNSTTLYWTCSSLWLETSQLEDSSARPVTSSSSARRRGRAADASWRGGAELTSTCVRRILLVTCNHEANRRALSCPPHKLCSGRVGTWRRRCCRVPRNRPPFNECLRSASALRIRHSGV